MLSHFLKKNVYIICYYTAITETLLIYYRTHSVYSNLGTYGVKGGNSLIENSQTL